MTGGICLVVLQSIRDRLLLPRNGGQECDHLLVPRLVFCHLVAIHYNLRNGVNFHWRPKYLKILHNCLNVCLFWEVCCVNKREQVKLVLTNVDEVIKNTSEDSKMIFINHRVSEKVNKDINGIYSYLLVQNKMANI